MPFFNFRRQDKPAASGTAATANDSADAIRKRAKHRLMGSTLLVLLGILGFPLLFETQPRPIPVDIPIEIPAKNSVKPLPTPAPAKAATSTTVPAEKVLPPAPVVAKAEPSQTAPPTSAPAAPVKTPEPKTATAPAIDSKPTAKPSTKAEPAAAQKATSAEPKPAPDDAARASALLNGAESVPATQPKSVGAEGRFIVQVGAFADVSKAREVRAQLEKAGLKTYTHVAETPQGKRIRVRVGPFANRAEADKAAQKIKTLDLPAAILTL